MFLQANETAALNKVRQKITESASVAEIAQAVDAANAEVADKDIAAVYAGVLLANHKRLGDACLFLDMRSYNSFAAMLSAYLKDNGRFSVQSKCFSDSRPYDIFTETAFYKAHMFNTVRIINKFATDNPPSAKEKANGGPTIVDIGSGNGMFIARLINSLATVAGLSSCRLIVIDHSQAMHEATERYCRDNVEIPLTFSHIVGRLQDLQAKTLQAALGEKNIWFINGSLSLHHMPDTDKVRVLSELKTFAPFLLITEGHANNDVTEKDTPEFVYSLATNYNYYISNVLEAPLSAEDKKDCINDFLLTEVITMLTNERKDRIDYHATTEQWADYANRAGYKVAKISKAVAIPQRTITFTMQLNA